MSYEYHVDPSDAMEFPQCRTPPFGQALELCPNPRRSAPPRRQTNWDAAFPEPKAGSPARHEDTEDYSDLEDAALDVRTWASTAWLVFEETNISLTTKEDRASSGSGSTACFRRSRRPPRSCTARTARQASERRE